MESEAEHEAKMKHDLRQSVRRTLIYFNLPNAEPVITEILNRLYRQYGLRGLCGYTASLIHASAPAAFKDALEKTQAEREVIVMPLLDLDDGEVEVDDDGTITGSRMTNAVTQYIASVLARDTDNTVALFKANMVGDLDWAREFLSLVVSAACNSFNDPEGSFHEVHL